MNQYQVHNSYFPWQHLHADWTLGMVGMFWTLMLLFNKFPQRGDFFFFGVSKMGVACHSEYLVHPELTPQNAPARNDLSNFKTKSMQDYFSEKNVATNFIITILESLC